MKKLYKLSLLILIPVLAGIILIVVGVAASNEQVLHAGLIIFEIVVPAVMLILITVSLVLIITGRLSDAPKNTKEKKDKRETVKQRKSAEDNEPHVSAKEKEYSDLEEINSTYGYESRRKHDEYMIEHTAAAYKNSSLKEKILGWLFLGFLITDFFMILVFAFLGIMLGAIICFCLFAGTIIFALIIKKISEHISLNFKPGKSKKNVKVLHGIVEACLLSSASGTGGDRRSSTARITNVVYKVKISADNEEYTAYSKEFYEVGDAVTVVVAGSHAAIIDEENEVEKEEDEL